LAIREARRQAKGLRWDSLVITVSKHDPLNVHGAP
jgi:hypothetical protein